MSETNPTVSEIEAYLTEYGIHFQKSQNAEGLEYLVAPFMLENRKAVLVAFRVEGEFVIVSTINFVKKVTIEYAPDLLGLNDKLKLIKLFLVETDGDKMDLDAGFELWADAWNKETFYCFIDALFLGLERVLQFLSENDIQFETDWVEFQ